VFNCVICAIFVDINKTIICYRSSVSAREVFAASLRILATGESFRSVHFSFRLGETTIRRYFTRVCRALMTALKGEYMQVCFVLLYTLLTHCLINHQRHTSNAPVCCNVLLKTD